MPPIMFGDVIASFIKGAAITPVMFDIVIEYNTDILYSLQRCRKVQHSTIQYSTVRYIQIMHYRKRSLVVSCVTSTGYTMQCPQP